MDASKLARLGPEVRAALALLLKGYAITHQAAPGRHRSGRLMLPDGRHMVVDEKQLARLEEIGIPLHTYQHNLNTPWKTIVSYAPRANLLAAFERIPPLWTLHEAMEQVCAALPDAGFARRYGVDPRVVDELSLMIKHFPEDNPTPALLALSAARRCLGPAWADHQDGEPLAVSVNADQTIDHTEQALALDSTPCVLSCDQRVVIDVVDDAGRTRMLHQSLADLRAKWPDAQVVKLYESQYVIDTPLIDRLPLRISQDEYSAAMQKIAPKFVRRSEGAETFIEPASASTVTAIFAQVDGRCWSFNDRGTLSHEAIIDKVRTLAPLITSCKPKSAGIGF